MGWVVCFPQLREQYLQQVGTALAAATSWQRAEACLFSIRAINLSLKERLLGRSQGAADVAGSHAFLGELVRPLIATCRLQCAS
jgi:hypothetical protein